MPSWLFHDYWPWWLCAGFFGTFTVGVWLLERRLIGVSGIYAAAIERTRAEEAAARKLDEADPEELDAALMRATLAAFGPDALDSFEKQHGSSPPGARPPVAPPRFLPRSANVTFLVMLAVGGALGALVQGSWEVRFDLGAAHEALTGGGLWSLAALVFGGVLVGFGTRMAGGCTSGHGLSGCSRLVPASLAATASFFGTGVAVSLLLEALAR